MNTPILKLLSLIWLGSIASVPALSQVTDAEKQLKTQSADTLMGWKRGGLININTSQTSLTNWSAGGQSSVAVGGLLSLHAQRKNPGSVWENYLDVGYGTLKQGKESGWWKTDDKIDFTTKYAINLSQKMYLAALAAFRTQMADGFNYPNDSVKISGLLAPGYLVAGLGIDYKPNSAFNLYVSPFTYKLTVVSDEALSDAGAFGVDQGKSSKNEFGGYLRAFYTLTLMENIGLQSKLDLFSNYLKNPQNVDVSWEVLLTMKVNTFISATLATHLLYDDDIDISADDNDDGIIGPDESHPRVQFKEVLAVGLTLKF